MTQKIINCNFENGNCHCELCRNTHHLEKCERELRGAKELLVNREKSHQTAIEEWLIYYHKELRPILSLADRDGVDGHEVVHEIGKWIDRAKEAEKAIAKLRKETLERDRDTRVIRMTDIEKRATHHWLSNLGDHGNDEARVLARMFE